MIKPQDRQIAQKVDAQGIRTTLVSNCPQDDGTGYNFFPLGFSPQQGQYIRVKFYGASPEPERLVIWSGGPKPVTPVGQISSRGTWEMLEINSWAGEQLWFTFQHCVNGRWIDYELTSYDDRGSTNAAYMGRLDSLDPYNPNTPTSIANILWGPNIQPIPTTANTPTYSVIFENIEILKTRSRDDDTNYATLGVDSPVSGKMGPVTRFLGDQDDGVHGVGLTVDKVLLPRDNSKVNIVWSVVNSGHENADKITNALQTTVEQLLDEIFGKDSIISEVGSKIFSLGLTFLFANCDGPVVGGNKAFTGTQLHADTANGDLVFTIDHPGTDSERGCGGNSQYRSTIRIRRTAN